MPCSYAAWFVTEERNKSPGTLPVLFWNLFYLLICSCSTCLSSHTRSQCSCLALEPPLLFFFCVLGLCWTFLVWLRFCLRWLPRCGWLLDFPLLPSLLIWIPLLDRYTSHLKCPNLLLVKLPDDWFSNLLKCVLDLKQRTSNVWEETLLTTECSQGRTAADSIIIKHLSVSLRYVTAPFAALQHLPL